MIGLGLISVIFYACNQPAPTQPSFSGKLALDGYGETLDSAYYKVWSDSSWEEFNGDTSINGLTYSTILASDSSQYYYDSFGNYAGFELPQFFGDVIIIFDSALASLPDTMIGNLTYQQETTFSLQGVVFSIIDDETLVDSGTVVTSFGTFSNCPGISSNELIVSEGNVIAGNNVVYWLARGPSDVEQDFYDANGYPIYTVIMWFGVVNGQNWGIGTTKAQLRIHGGSSAESLRRGRESVTASKIVPDMHSLGPIILKGIRRAPSKIVRR